LTGFRSEVFQGQYNLIMSRWFGLAFMCLIIGSFAISPQQKPPAQEQQPPEEDEAQKPKEYSFNPLQAEKEMRIGNFYFHKKSYRAAAQRFREATRWNGNLAEAYFRLGEAEEKQKDWQPAREAYEKFLELAADDKRSPDIRKKVAKLSKGRG
jgi:tetratricopeptide (TPR) repeat protein